MVNLKDFVLQQRKRGDAMAPSRHRRDLGAVYYGSNGQVLTPESAELIDRDLRRREAEEPLEEVLDRARSLALRRIDIIDGDVYGYSVTHLGAADLLRLISAAENGLRTSAKGRSFEQVEDVPPKAVAKIQAALKGMVILGSASLSARRPRAGEAEGLYEVMPDGTRKPQFNLNWREPELSAALSEAIANAGRMAGMYKEPGDTPGYRDAPRPPTPSAGPSKARVAASRKGQEAAFQKANSTARAAAKKPAAKKKPAKRSSAKALTARTITDAQIKRLREDAKEAGDRELVRTCDRALKGGGGKAECAAAINDAKGGG